jgi:hypothetical protein
MAIQRCYLTITEGNLNNYHLYLSKVLDMFPSDVIGGRNKLHVASRTVRIEWGNQVVETDIVGDKKIFRKRGWMARFYEANRLQPGDKVLLEQVSPYVYRLSAAAQIPLVA